MAPKILWAYDFVFDTTASGQQIKCLTVVDEYTRECLASDVAGAIRSKWVIDVLSRLASLRGAPLFMCSDSGPAFVSHAILEWCRSRREAAVIIEAWCHHYNEARSHSSPQYLPKRTGPSPDQRSMS